MIQIKARFFARNDCSATYRIVRAKDFSPLRQKHAFIDFAFLSINFDNNLPSHFSFPSMKTFLLPSSAALQFRQYVVRFALVVVMLNLVAAVALRAQVFGNVVVGSSAEGSFVVNTGCSGYTSTISASFVPGCIIDFSLTSGGPYSTSLSFTRSAFPQTIYTRYRPTAIGSHSGPINFNRRVAGGFGCGSGFFATIFGYSGFSGTGVIPTIAPGVATVNFGNVVVGQTSAAQSYGIIGTNTIGPITVSVPAQYEIANAAGGPWGTITGVPAAGGTVWVRFAPSAVGAVGGNASHTSPSASTVNVALSGTGVIPSIATSAAGTLNFGTLAVGQTSAAQSYTVTGTNTVGAITVTAPAQYQVASAFGGPWGGSVSLPAAGGTAWVRFAPASAGTATGNVSHASSFATTVNVPVNGTAVVPTITLSTVATMSFGTIEIGQTSLAQSYTVTGTNTIAPLTVTAPTDFQVAAAAGGPWGTSITLPAAGGTVFARFAPTVSGLVGGNIAHTSSFAATVNLAVNGTGINIAGMPPVVASFAPTSVPGGGTVIVTGSNFSATTQVQFGGVNAASFTVNSPYQITAVLSSGGTSGSVSVIKAAGTATLPGFTFLPPPNIGSFAPTSAPVGATITINGVNFLGTTQVQVGGVNVSSFTVVSATQITAVIAPGTPSGSVNVVSGTGSGSLSGFTIILPPTISSFAPVSAATGAPVVITGTNLTAATQVQFGGVNAASYTVDSPTQITATVSGGGASGSVSVTTIAGTANQAGFTFIPPPSITSFSPMTAAAGTTVFIYGTNFSGTTQVRFGGVNAATYIIFSPTEIRAVVSAGGASGAVNVVTPGGSASLAGFTFLPPPTITSFTPTSAVGGSVVTINGSNFVGVTQVQFGAVNAASFTVISPTQITATLPASGVSAVVNVQVTTTGGSALLGGLTVNYPPTINLFSPAAAPADAAVIITGQNFTGATQVQFGGVDAASFTVLSPTSISAIVSSGGASGSVRVTTPFGTASGAGFTYKLLHIASFSPTTGGIGDIITIMGGGFIDVSNVVVAGVPVASFTVVTSGQIQAVLASGETAIGNNVQVFIPSRSDSRCCFTYNDTFHYVSGEPSIRTNWESYSGTPPLVGQFLTKPGHRYIFTALSVPTAINLANPITIGAGVVLKLESNVILNNYGGITVASGATLTINSGAEMVNYSLITNNGVVNNQGTLAQAMAGIFSGTYPPLYSGTLAKLAYKDGATDITTGLEFPPALHGRLVIDRMGRRVTLNADKTVNGLTEFNNGTFVLGNYSLTLNASMAFPGSGFVAGGAGASLNIGGTGPVSGRMLVGTPAQFGGGLTMNRAGAALTLDGIGISSTPLSVLAGSLYTGTVNHSFSAPITIGSSAELDVNAGSTTTFGGNSVNNGALALNGTLNMGTTTMSGTGALTINPTGTLVTAHPTGLVGALTNSGAVTHNGTVHIQGASVGNSLGLNLNNLVIDRATAVTLPQNLRVNGNIGIINAGNFDLAGRQLTFGTTATTSTSATGTIDASGAASIVTLTGTSLNGAHFTGGAIRTLNIGVGVPTISNSLAITSLFNMTNNITLGAPNGRLWLRSGATLNAPGTKIQGTNQSSEVIVESGFNARQRICTALSWRYQSHRSADIFRQPYHEYNSRSAGVERRNDTGRIICTDAESNSTQLLDGSGNDSRFGCIVRRCLRNGVQWECRPG